MCAFFFYEVQVNFGRWRRTHYHVHTFETLRQTVLSLRAYYTIFGSVPCFSEWLYKLYIIFADCLRTTRTKIEFYIDTKCYGYEWCSEIVGAAANGLYLLAWHSMEFSMYMQQLSYLLSHGRYHATDQVNFVFGLKLFAQIFPLLGLWPANDRRVSLIYFGGFFLGGGGE